MKLFGKKQGSWQLPEGWTETKIDDNHYITHVPKEQIEKWENDRRTKDKVKELASKPGFYLKSHGRSGMAYYVENGKICEIYFELSGNPKYDLLFWFDSLDNWFYPVTNKMTPEEKETIKQKLRSWLKGERIKSDL